MIKQTYRLLILFEFKLSQPILSLSSETKDNDKTDLSLVELK